MTTVRIASINTNGIRAAYRKGMADWLGAAGVDVLAIQEVRAETPDVLGLLGPDWHVHHDAATKKGYAGVVLASRVGGLAGEPVRTSTAFGPDDLDTAGRWAEAEFDVAGTPLTVVSCYTPSGGDDPTADPFLAKMRFLPAMSEAMDRLGTGGGRALVVGDFNVGHTKLDIKNWKGNLKNIGFLPEERAHLDRFVELGWVDVGRRWHGEVDGPYTWWSQRGQAFDKDTGWRIDYHFATPALAEGVRAYRVDRYPSYDVRWSDHAPVVVDYEL